MFTTALIAIFSVGMIGLGVLVALRYMEFTDYNDSPVRISASEFVAALLAATILVTPTVLVIGKHLSVNQALKYEEFYNGVEVSADVGSRTCHAGHAGSSESSGQSNCYWVYDSGDYTYPAPYTDTECSTDSKGNMSCKTVTKCCRPKWADIYSPYATKEYWYSVSDSLGGSHEYDKIYLASDPEPATSKRIPSNIPRGAPEDWLDAKSHLESGDPRPVTRMFEYDNYILASKEDLLKANDANVQQYLKDKLLPEHTQGIRKDPVYGPSNRQAKKVSFVGVDVPDQDQWQDALMRFNAACGMKLQCDLHVVLIDSAKVPRSDAGQYVQALKAYWQSDRFEKRAISKNGVILVIGTRDDKTIEWANATTGMPYGNNVMLESMASQLADKPLDPNIIFGSPRTVATPYKDKEGDTKYKVTVTHSEPKGVLESVMFDESYGFQRPCMESCENGEIGYADLINQIEPSTGAKVWMVIIICLFSIFFWWLVAATSIADIGSYLPRKSDKKHDPKNGRYDRYMEWSNK